MALFTDGLISSLEDLVAYDSQLLNVATVEQIDVTSKLASAQEDVGLQLATFLNRLHFVEQPGWMTKPPRLNDIVVTGALKLWHIYRTLEMVYGDAFSSQLNDRYAAKQSQFHGAAQQACERLIQIGVGVASHPVPQAKPPEVIAVPGRLPDGTYYVTMTWLNSIGEAGASAVPTAVTLSAGTFQVMPAAAPRVATSWNVFAGRGPEDMYQQNSSVIPAGNLWVQTTALSQRGERPGRGQEPNYLKQIPRVSPRG